MLGVFSGFGRTGQLVGPGAAGWRLRPGMACAQLALEDGTVFEGEAFGIFRGADAGSQRIAGIDGHIHATAALRSV